MKFILASKSPRRRDILRGIGLEFDIIESGADESDISKNMHPKLYVQELAMIKSSSVAQTLNKGYLVIGADTVVVHNGKIIGKPNDFDDAYNMLSSFSGSSHKVYTGISLTSSTDMHTVTAYSETEVYFDEISESEIINYINKYAPYDKAGAYGIQEYAGVFVNRIEGDFFNVVGLPVSKLYSLLKTEFDVIL